jgi:hypothetical protein
MTDKKDFEDSWRGNPPNKKPLSMLVVKMEMECSCNSLFFTRFGTTDLLGDFEKKCPLCKRYHHFSWSIQTKLEEEVEKDDT